MADPLGYALSLLKRRLRSRRELEQALLRKGFEKEEISQALQQLEEQKFVDDKHFAEAWSRTRDVLSPRGKSRLRLELMEKGIPKEVINQVLLERQELAEEGEQPSELELAKDAVARRERVYAHLAPEVRARRLMSFLQRRGFSYEVIRRILNV